MNALLHVSTCEVIASLQVCDGGMICDVAVRWKAACGPTVLSFSHSPITTTQCAGSSLQNYGWAATNGFHPTIHPLYNYYCGSLQAVCPRLPLMQIRLATHLGRLGFSQSMSFLLLYLNLLLIVTWWTCSYQVVLVTLRSCLILHSHFDLIALCFRHRGRDTGWEWTDGSATKFKMLLK